MVPLVVHVTSSSVITLDGAIQASIISLLLQLIFVLLGLPADGVILLVNILIYRCPCSIPSLRKLLELCQSTTGGMCVPWDLNSCSVQNYKPVAMLEWNFVSYSDICWDMEIHCENKNVQMPLICYQTNTMTLVNMCFWNLTYDCNLVDCSSAGWLARSSEVLGTLLKGTHISWWFSSTTLEGQVMFGLWTLRAPELDGSGCRETGAQCGPAKPNSLAKLYLSSCLPVMVEY